MKIIQLDGASGGGQMLRTALSLSMITGQPFRMVNIRGKRQRPGLMRQHLTCVKAACEISDGTADGAEIGSKELVFRAGSLKAGDYAFSIGTAGSTSLLFQTLLPALLFADGKSTLHLQGGTHNPLAPPFDFIDRVYLPGLRRMGAVATVSLETAGFAPAGGGGFRAGIEACPKLQPLEWVERGELVSSEIRVVYRDLPESIPQRILEAASQDFVPRHLKLERLTSGHGPGVCCFIQADFTNACDISSAIGEIGLSSERLGHRAAKSMRNFMGCGIPVGRSLADQMLLPMALAGSGEFHTMAADAHVPTNIAVIEKFLPVRFSMIRINPAILRIAVE